MKVILCEWPRAPVGRTSVRQLTFSPRCRTEVRPTGVRGYPRGCSENAVWVAAGALASTGASFAAGLTGSCLVPVSGDRDQPETVVRPDFSHPPLAHVPRVPLVMKWDVAFNPAHISLFGSQAAGQKRGPYPFFVLVDSRSSRARSVK